METLQAACKSKKIAALEPVADMVKAQTICHLRVS